MAQTYRQLLAKVADDQEAQAKIKSAQTAWVVYRDAFLEAMWPRENKEVEYGTSYPLLYGEQRIKLTKQQIDVLKDLIVEYTPH